MAASRRRRGGSFLRFPDDNRVASYDELHFGIREQPGFLADFDGNSNLAFTGDTHEGVLI
jgi:hypothetical protein